MGELISFPYVKQEIRSMYNVEYYIAKAKSTLFKHVIKWAPIFSCETDAILKDIEN